MGFAPVCYLSHNAINHRRVRYTLFLIYTVKRLFLVLFNISALGFSQEKSVENSIYIKGEWNFRSPNCSLTLFIKQEEDNSFKYRIVTRNRDQSGKINFVNRNNKTNIVLLNVEDDYSPILELKNDTLYFQKYSNSWYRYARLGACDEKYVYLKKRKQTILIDNAKKAEDIVPDNWKIITSTVGDLNNDGLEDLAIVVQENDSTKLIKSTDWHPRNRTINLNTRLFAIYFKNNKDLYTKVLQSEYVVAKKSSPDMPRDPLHKIVITNKGILQIEHNYYYDGGFSRLYYNSTLKFKYTGNNNFSLIGLEASETNNNPRAGITNYSLNMLAMREKITYYDKRSDSENEQWRDLYLNPITLNGIDVPILIFLNHTLMQK